MIEDDVETMVFVADVLTSLGHAFDYAPSQKSARNFIGSHDYAYVLLDLEIPVREGAQKGRTQTGKNLLREILDQPGGKLTPVIIMAEPDRNFARGSDGKDGSG